MTDASVDEIEQLSDRLRAEALVFNTPEAAIAAAMTLLLRELAEWGDERGLGEARIARLQALLQQLLHERRETMCAMLEARTTSVQ